MSYYDGTKTICAFDCKKACLIDKLHTGTQDQKESAARSLLYQCRYDIQSFEEDNRATASFYVYVRQLYGAPVLFSQGWLHSGLHAYETELETELSRPSGYCGYIHKVEITPSHNQTTWKTEIEYTDLKLNRFEGVLTQFQGLRTKAKAGPEAVGTS